MAYFEPVSNQPGLNKLPSNPCKLLGMELLVLTDGQSYTGKTGEREVLAVLLGGKGTFKVGGHTFAKVGEPNVTGLP